MNDKSSDKILAIIPARGGSKEIPRKNIRLLAGKTLIAYSIEAALKSRYINRVIVSTEDEEIAEIPKKYGAEVIKRPKELAKDSTPTIEVIFHILDAMGTKNYNPEVIILLQPTSPLRNMNDIDSAINLFLKNDCESVVSVCELEHSSYWNFEIKEEYLKPIFGEKYLRMRRQELPKVYMPNGAVFVSTPEVLRKYQSFYCAKTIPYIMPMKRSVDIDKLIDFEFAEFLLKRDYDGKNKNR